MESPKQPQTEKLNRLKKLWQEGVCPLGAIATVPSVQSVQVMGRSGLDWIIIDMEHGPIDLAAAHAMIVATSGTPIGPYDMLIAAHARHIGATVVTNNEREFRRVPGLSVRNWLKA